LGQTEKMKAIVIGTGAMGSGIAQVLASSGATIMLYDSNAAAVDRALKHIQANLNRLAEKGKITASAANEIFRRIDAVSDLRDCKDADLAIEAIVEDLGVKQKLFSELEGIVKPDTILATNTSSLSVAAISASLQNKSRFIGIHFFNPAPLMPLVEIIPGFVTSDETLNRAVQHVKDWGKVGVVAKDTPGFIVNRLARPFYGEALRIAEEGIANFETIDFAMKRLGSFRMGPFELMDFIGHDVNYRVTESVWQQMFYDPRYRPSLIQKRLFESGLYGRKTGRGYYVYEAENRICQEIDADEKVQIELFERMMVMLFNEALEALYLGVGSAEDLDTAVVKGVNYPKGLLAWASEWGYKKILDKLEDLQRIYGDDRYRPSLLLRRFVETNKI